MKQALETIPIWDAFSQGTECPLCILASRVEDSFLTSYLEEFVMDASSRNKVIQSGFCNGHLYKLLEYHDNLGLALTLESIIKGLLLPKDLTSSSQGNPTRGSRLLRSLLPKDRKTKDSEQSREWGFTFPHQDTCLACQHISSFIEQYCHLIARMYYDDPEFREAFLKSKGFCIPHSFIFVENLKENPQSARNREIISETLRLLRASLERLLKELGWFIKKYDYRFANEPWEGTEDSVVRAIQKLVGLPGMKSPGKEQQRE
ncbi:MAG: DUF6062 family protein [Candidatus Caldatribacteriaceae bacterium]